jgi:multiple sugar transport system permease protein
VQGALRRGRTHSKAVQYAFIAPALLLLVAVVGMPMATAVWISLNRVKLTTPDQAFMGFATTFVGLANYANVLRNQEVQQALANTAIFTLASVLCSLLLGLGFALLVNQEIRFRTVWRLLLLTPWVVAPVVAAGTWRWIYDPRYGVLNDLVRRIGLASEPIPWLYDPHLALWSVIAANVWLRIPFMMVMLLAGLQAIPIEQYEAASVDGAGSWQRFRYVTLPHLRFVITVACLLEAIWQFKHFDLIQVMTGGGPGHATEVLSTLVYRNSFQFFEFGPASAIGVLMAAILLVVAAVYLRLLRGQGAS